MRPYTKTATRTIDGETSSRPGPQRRMPFTSLLSPHALGATPPSSLRCLRLRRRHQCGLQLAHVLRAEEDPDRGVDGGVPRVVRDDAVRQGAGELVGLPLLEGPLEVRVVLGGVRVLARRDRALERVERVLGLLRAEEAEPLLRGRRVRSTLGQRE